MISLLQVQKFRGKMGDTMADKNYLHTAYANSADGTDGFTTTYPNLNLLDGTSSTLKTVSAKGWGYNYIDKKLNTLNLIKGQTLTYNVWIQDCDIDTRGVIYLYDPQDKQYNFFGNIIKAGTSGFSTITFTIDIDVSKYTVAIGLLSAPPNYHNLSYSKLKLEQGSTATPHMPSASEVTTADWPKFKFVGTYVDTNPVSSTNSSKYDWDEMKYRVYLDGTPVGGSKLLSFDLENLKAGTSYNVQVSQINGNVESDKSESVAFKTTLTQ